MSSRVSHPSPFTSAQAGPNASREYPLIGARPLTTSPATAARAPPRCGAGAATGLEDDIVDGLVVGVGGVDVRAVVELLVAVEVLELGLVEDAGREVAGTGTGEVVLAPPELLEEVLGVEAACAEDVVAALCAVVEPTPRTARTTASTTKPTTKTAPSPPPISSVTNTNGCRHRHRSPGRGPAGG